MDGVDPDTLLEWLQTGAGEERDLQLMALEQLCMLLLMSDNIDRCFESCPPRTFIPALCRIFLDETAPDNVLEVTARAITYYLDVSNECTRRITQVEGAVKAICNRLSVAEMDERTSKDLAEQCVKLLEHICQRETPAVYEAGGLQCILVMIRQHGHFIHRDTLHSAMSVVTRLCGRVEPQDASIRECTAGLGALLAHEDAKVAESALRCFAALTDRFIRKAMDPAELAEPSDLVSHLLKSLIPGDQSADGAQRSPSFVSIVLSLLSNLCRGSATVTDQIVSSPDLIPALKSALSNRDERCVLDSLRLADLIVILLCEGRSAFPKASSVLGSSDSATSFTYDRAHRYLIDAIRQRDTDALIDAIESGNVDPNFTDDVGQTLLNWCAAFGTLDMVQYLCDKGADVNRGQRSSSLHYAACFGRITIALLRNGANPDLRDEDGRTALDKARERVDEGHLQVVQILESPSSYMTNANAARPAEAAKQSAEAKHPVNPEIRSRVVQQFIPIFCVVFTESLTASVRRSTLSLIKKCVEYCPMDAFEELVAGRACKHSSDETDEDTAAAFIEGLMKVIVAVFNEESVSEGHEQAILILKSLFEKNPTFWLDQLIRLGIVEKVEHLATNIDESPAADMDSSSSSQPAASASIFATEPMDTSTLRVGAVTAERSTTSTPSIGVISDTSSICPANESAYADRIRMLNIPIQTDDEMAVETETPPPTVEALAEEIVTSLSPINVTGLTKEGTDRPAPASLDQPSTSGATPSLSLSADCWNLEEKNLYKWKDWRVMRSSDSLFICDGSNGWLRFFMDGRLHTMYSSGAPEAGADNAETRGDFIRKFQNSRHSAGTAGVAPKPILSVPHATRRLESGNWYLLSTTADELIIVNREGQQQKIIIKDDLPGFQFEASKFSTRQFMAESTLGCTFVTGWAARGGERRLKFRAEAQRHKIHELAKELYEAYLKEAHNKPRDVFIQLRDASAALAESTKACAKFPEEFSGTKILEQRLCAVRDLIINDRLLSTFELATSGVIPAFLELVGAARAVRNGVVYEVFQSVFADEAMLSSLVRRIVQVLEFVEKFSQILYDTPGGSAFGLQMLTRRLRFSMQQSDSAAQSELLNRTGRIMRTEPLTSVGQVRAFVNRMVSKMWYDFPRESLYFVRQLSSASSASPLSLSYTSDFDTNGLMWYLGTNANTNSEWVNPAAVGLVSVSASDGSRIPYGVPEDILSRDTNAMNCHSTDTKDANFVIDLGVFIRPNAYTLRHARGYGRSALRCWDIEGSTDGTKFTLLRHHENDKSLNAAGSTATFDLDPKESVRFIRIQQRGPNSSGITHYLSLSGFEIYGDVVGIVRDVPFAPVREEAATSTTTSHRREKKSSSQRSSGIQKDSESKDSVSKPKSRSHRSSRKTASHNNPQQSMNFATFVKILENSHRLIDPSDTTTPNKATAAKLIHQSSDSSNSLANVLTAHSTALNPATVATALATSNTQPAVTTSIASPAIQQKSMSTTNLLDAHMGHRTAQNSVAATGQASSAESLQRQSPSLENLLSRARLFAGERRIPEPVPENDALNEYNSYRASHEDSTNTLASQNTNDEAIAEEDGNAEPKNLSASTPELAPKQKPIIGENERPLIDVDEVDQQNFIRRLSSDMDDDYVVEDFSNAQLYNGIVEMYQEMLRSGEIRSIEDVGDFERTVLSRYMGPLDDGTDMDEGAGFDDVSQFDVPFIDTPSDANNVPPSTVPPPSSGASSNSTSAPSTAAPSRRTLSNLGSNIRSRIGNYAGALRNIVTQAVEPSTGMPSRPTDPSYVDHLEDFLEELFNEDEDCEEFENNEVAPFGNGAPGTMELVDRLRQRLGETITPDATSTIGSSLPRLNWRQLLRVPSGTSAPTSTTTTNTPSTSGQPSSSIGASVRQEFARLFPELLLGSGAEGADNSLNSEMMYNMLDAAANLHSSGGASANSSLQHRSNNGGKNTRKPTRNWDDEYVLRRAFSALIPAFDPRPGRNNINQTQDVELPVHQFDTEERRRLQKSMSINSTVPATRIPLNIYLSGPNLTGVSNVTIELDRDDETMFSAVQRLTALSTAASAATTSLSAKDRGRRVWEPTYTIIYESSVDDENSKVSAATATNSTLLNELNNLQDPIVRQTLDTVRGLHALAGERSSASAFISLKLTQKLTQQLSDPLVVCADALPPWCEALVFHYPCLFSLETRTMFLRATAFGVSRAIIWLQNRRDQILEESRSSGGSVAGSTLAGVRREDHYPEFRIGRIKHERIKVQRSDDQLFQNASRIMQFHAYRKAILEVEYVGEEGTGLGPTLEFYALVAAEFQRKSLAIWLCDDADEQQQRMEADELDLGEGKKPPGYYIRRSGGLFPAPAPPNSPEAVRMSEMFQVLGIFLAKVLQDGRLVDLPLSLPFLRLLISDSVAGFTDDDIPRLSLAGLLGLPDLDEVHHHKGRFLRAVQRLCIEKARIRADQTISASDKAERMAELRIRFNEDEGEHEHECKIEDLGLTFVVNPPSAVFHYAEHELIPNGTNIDVTIDNVELYLGKCVDFYLNSGIRQQASVFLEYNLVSQVSAFREGFDSVFPLRSLKTFTAVEIQLLLSGEQCPEWTREDLINFTEPKLGYTRESPGFLRFVDVVASLNAAERKAFLQFSTGCSSLPPGGLANLHPRLTIVRKVDSGGDGSYPSVNTCVHYLKLPEYSSTEVLRERLLAATHEKGFHLN